MSKQKFTSGEKVNPATEGKVITTDLKSDKWLGDKPLKKITRSPKGKSHKSLETEEG